MNKMKTILVVDDETSIRRSLVAQLHQEFQDAEFLEARTVEGANKQITEAKQGGRSIDLTVVDLRLPQRGQSDIDGGFDVLHTLRDTFPRSQSLIVTVRDDPAAKLKAQEINAQLISKPFDKTNLVKTVRTMLSRSADPIVQKP